MNEKTDITDITDSTEVTDIPMRILRVATCPSLSGRSILRYHVGCNDTGAIHFRLWGNTAAGMFSNMWVSMVDLSGVLSSLDTFTSSALAGTFEQLSRNNPGFCMAVLQNELLIEKSATKPGTYTTANPAPFLERINALIASGVELSEDDEPSDALPIAAVATTKRAKSKKQSA